MSPVELKFKKFDMLSTKIVQKLVQKLAERFERINRNKNDCVIKSGSISIETDKSSQTNCNFSQSTFLTTLKFMLKLLIWSTNLNAL